MFRRIVVTATVLAALLTANGPVEAAPCWRPPVVGPVTDPFRTPPCPYCAGNRGLEYEVGPNAAVRAVAAGVVTWAGSIAGIRYVVVQHPNDWRVTYGGLSSSSRRIGDRVVRRSLIGAASGSFHFGLRIGAEYSDPEPYLGRPVGRPRLIPIDGSAARPSPPLRWRCGTA